MKADEYLKAYRETVFKRSVSYPPLKKADFELFFETGNRLVYEKKYFAVRKALTITALKVILSESPKKTDVEELVAVIHAILSEPVWALPAHCPKDAWDTGNYGIDLFAAETAGSLAEILYLTKDCLEPLEAEELGRLALQKIRAHVLDKWDRGAHGWEKGKDNWTAVCAGNIGIASRYLYLLGLIQKEEWEKNADRACDSMLTYLAGFGNDGCCLEGISYYNYGMAYFLGFLELLEESGAFPKRTKEIKSEINKRRACRFPFGAYLENRMFAAFSDTTGKEKPDLGIISFISHLDSSVKLPEEYSNDPDPLKGAEVLGGEECGRFALALREYRWVEKYGEGLKTESEESVETAANAGNAEDAVATDYRQRETLFEEAEWYIARSSHGASLAVKGGTNNEPHNHNDVGSFIYAVDGESIICDPGSGEYTADYFGEKRYDYLCTRSLGHNVPLLNGKEQTAATGKDATTLRKGAFSFENGIFKKDLSPAYGETPGTLVRTVECRLPYVKITDECKQSLTENLVFFKEPEINGNSVRIAVKDRKTYVRIEFKNASFVTKETLKYKDHSGEEQALYRVSAEKTPDASGISIDIQLVTR